jgi:nucleoside 2-deoxyribosyltransferase
MLVYFAGPLFSEAERQYNARLTERIEALGYRVFLPQRDGVEQGKPPYDTMTRERRRVAIFELDRDKILEADVFLFLLDGRVPDEGACVELGIAYAHKTLRQSKKLLIGLHTDQRTAFMNARLNPMIAVPIEYVARDPQELLAMLAKYLE